MYIWQANSTAWLKSSWTNIMKSRTSIWPVECAWTQDSMDVISLPTSLSYASWHLQACTWCPRDISELRTAQEFTTGVTYFHEIHWTGSVTIPHGFFRQNNVLGLINIFHVFLVEKILPISVWNLQCVSFDRFSHSVRTKMDLMLCDVTRVLPSSVAPNKLFPIPLDTQAETSCGVDRDASGESVTDGWRASRSYHIKQRWGWVRKPTHASFFFLFSFLLNIKLFLRK